MSGVHLWGGAGEGCFSIMEELDAYSGEALEMGALLKMPGDGERNLCLCAPAKAKARYVSGQLLRAPSHSVPCPAASVISQD